MNINKMLLNTTLAVAAAATFATAPLTSALAKGTSTDVNCYGVNACKGQSDCKTKANNSCKGHNSCKGQGFKTMSQAECTKEGGTTTES